MRGSACVVIVLTLQLLGRRLLRRGAPDALSLQGKPSVYSLAVNANANVVATGSPEKVVRIWDPREDQGGSIKLVGHTDNVRALAVDAAGTLVWHCVSARARAVRRSHGP